MSHRGRRNADSRLLTALAAGDNVERAAAAAGVSARTAHRRLADPEFRQRVATEREKLIENTVAMLAAAGAKAVERLQSLLSVESPSVQLGAARGILEYLFRGHDQLLLVKQFAELQARIEAMENPAHAPPIA